MSLVAFFTSIVRRGVVTDDCETFAFVVVVVDGGAGVIAFKITPLAGGNAGDEERFVFE